MAFSMGSKPITPATRHTYWADGEWRINFNGTEYSGFAWIGLLAAFEDLGLNPAEIQTLVKAKKEGRLMVLPEGTESGTFATEDGKYIFTVNSCEGILNKQFRNAALNAHRNGDNFFMCPICKRLGSITRHTDAGIVAQCLICEKAVSISFSDPNNLG